MHDNLRSQKLAYSTPRFTLMARPRQDVESRFWSKVEKTATCWLWRGTLDTDGYPVFKLPKATGNEWWAPWSGSNVGAHIFSAMLADFRFADGHYLKHTCRNLACVNSAHLESCDPVDVQPSGVDVTNQDPAFWESVLKKCGLSMHAGLSKGKLFHNGLQGRLERDRREDDTEEQSAFEELMQQAQRSRRQLPETSPVPPAPPQDDDLPWRGMAYESRVRKLGN